MDGSGKTTTTNNLKKELSKSLINTKFIYTGRGRNNIIPISFFARFIKPPKDKKFNLNQDQQEEKVNLIRTMTSFVFAIDLLLRYLFIILPARKRYNLVITDRYSTDLLLMKGVPKRLKRFIYFFIPKPTKLIYLYQDIEILNKRKPEHPKQDLVRQEKLFSKILNKKIMKTKIVKIKNINLNKTINLCLENIFNELK
jgi:thymidylate kinase